MVTCYDIVEDKRVTHEMYFAPPSMPIIYQKYLMALGIKEYSIELIGTNANKKIDITYDFNLDSLIGLRGVFENRYPSEEQHYVSVGNDGYNQKIKVGNVKLSNGDDLATCLQHYGLKVSKWTTRSDGNGAVYSNNGDYFIDNNLILYAKWERET